MDKLYRQSFNRINSIPTGFTRYLYHSINWSSRLIILTGMRGAGKTTLVHQYIKQNFPLDQSVLSLNLDDIYFAENRLVDVAEDFYNNGGKFLFLDEVHKYATWNIEVKNIYDSYPDMQIVVSGSSILKIDQGKADLIRRMIHYRLESMSLREFIEFDQSVKLPSHTLDEILLNHIQISLDIAQKIKPLVIFKKYLEYGCFPFYKEDQINYHQRLGSIARVILEHDITSVVSIDFEHISKLKQLLYIISQSVPFTPNISQLASKIGIERRTALRYLDLLAQADLTKQLVAKSKVLSTLTKPEKIYLCNTNFAFALAMQIPNLGNLRETFFFNQLSAMHNVNYSKHGDFMVNGKQIFEVDGKGKDYGQIKNTPNSFLAVDDIATGRGNLIPLWLFGFLY